MSKKLEMIQVEWIDSASYNGWTALDEVGSIHSCCSIGWILRDGAKELVIASAVDESNGKVGHCLAIPRSCVKSMKTLSKKFITRTLEE